MKKLLFVLIIIMASCKTEAPKPDPIPVKPFIVVDKRMGFANKNYCNYCYVDKNGNRYWFSDRTIRYSIGDTLK